MSLGKKFFHQDAAATGDTSSAQGLVVHWDCNDEDSIENGGANVGNGSGTWFDISTHDLNVPLIDKASNLQLHLNASDTTSYNGSGTTWTDISQNTNNATKVNGPTYGSDVRGYFDMDGSDDIFEINYDASLYMTANTGFAIETWVNRDSDSEMYIISSKDNSIFPFALNWTSATHGYYGWICGSSLTSGAATGLNENTSNGIGNWDHVVITQSSSDRKNRLYVNGTLTATSSAVTGVHSTSSGVYVGSYWNGTGRFNGKIGVVRIYNSELTASEVAQNFRADCFLSYDSIYNTNLAIHLDAADASTVSATTWSDKANSNNATIGSSVGFSSTLSNYYDKELGNWLVLDGSDDNMTIASNSSFQNATAFTVEMWIEPISIGDNEMLSTLYTSGSDYKWDLRFNSASGDIRWGVANSSGGYVSSQDITTTDTLSTNNWHHLVATYDDSANTQKIFFNGIEVKSASSPTGGTRTGGSDDIDIGHRVGSYEANIKIGQYRLYNSSLTSAQVAQNYLATKNNYPNENHGTINGATFTVGSTGNPNYFDFSSDTITSSFAFINWSTTAWTIAFFAKAHSANNGYIFGTGAATGAAISFRSNNKVYLISGGNTEISFTINEYKHFVFTYDGNGTSKGYGNGVLTDTKTSVDSAFSSTANFRLGDYGGVGTGFDGELGQFKIFQKELSASEVSALYDLDKATYNLT